MRERLRLAGKAFLFSCLMGLMIYGINRTLTPKYRHSSINPLTETFRGFYRMERDTVDVLFLGSSQTAAGFNPQNLYDEFGIRSYNLGSNHQSLWLSYYWLKEALRYQSPRAVVLDCYELYIDGRKEEGNARLALDDMRWGAVKKEAVDTVCGFDKSQSRQGYLLTNIRFHTRWTGMSETDFTWAEMASVPQLKGFWLYKDICGYEGFVPFAVEPSREEEFLPEAREYLDKILKLCSEEGIRLILVKTPTLAQSLEKHNTIMGWARLNGLDFIDFNEREIYREAGLDYRADMNDTSDTGYKNAHANPAGARKMTCYLGAVLRDRYGIGPCDDKQWESTREFNDGVWKDFLLHNETDLSRYLAAVKDQRYTVFFSVKEKGPAYAGREQEELMRDMGLAAPWREGEVQPYISVIEKGAVKEEQTGDGRMYKLGAFRDGEMIYQMVGGEAECSVRINRVEQAKSRPGLNIVVYSNDTESVIDSVCFDICCPQLTAYR